MCRCGFDGKLGTTAKHTTVVPRMPMPGVRTSPSPQTHSRHVTTHDALQISRFHNPFRATVLCEVLRFDAFS